ncbi:virulence RhuM family protein [Bacteroides rodentium]
MKEAGEIILYQPDEEVRLEVRLEHETVWLTQEQIANLFGTKRPAITKHLNNIYNSGELDKRTTCSILEHVGNEGKQKYATQYYNLDAILSVGYRVNSRNATLFRRWASNILKEYLLKGYAINQRLSELEQTVTEHSKKIDFFVRASLPPIEGVFYNGQIFDAYKLVADIIKSAKKSILLIDNYVDESVLLMLAKRGLNVSATIYTSRVSSQLQLDLDRHNAQYPPILIKTYKNSHDRFLIIDNQEVYHIGASLKDLGKKLFAFSKLNEAASSVLKLIEE